jgi:hypothetical protein
VTNEPPLRYGTDSAGKRRPLCQEIRRHGVSYYHPAGEPCVRYATQRNAAGLMVCWSHGDRVVTRPPKREQPMSAAVWFDDEANAQTKCSGCGCSKHNPCVLKLDSAGSLGLCAHAGLEPWLAVCSGCMTPKKRTDQAAWRIS